MKNNLCKKLVLLMFPSFSAGIIFRSSVFLLLYFRHYTFYITYSHHHIISRCYKNIVDEIEMSIMTYELDLSTLYRVFLQSEGRFELSQSSNCLFPYIEFLYFVDLSHDKIICGQCYDKWYVEMEQREGNRAKGIAWYVLFCLLFSNK